MSYDLLDLATFTVALLALFVSIGSLFVSRRIAKIEIKKYREYNDPISLYVEDVFWLQDENIGRLYVFNLTITNSSTQSNSVISVDFHISYSKKGYQLHEKIHKPDVNKQSDSLVQDHAKGLSILNIPCFCQPRGATSGVVYYKVDGEFFRSCSVESYKLVLTTASGDELIHNPVIINGRK